MPMRHPRHHIGRSARALQERLSRSEALLRLVLETTSDGFCIIDPEGRFLEVNSAYCAMSGYTQAELLQLRIADVEVIESGQATSERIAGITEQGSARFESRHRRKDGCLFDVEVSINVLNLARGWLIAFCRDITPRKQAEVARREGEERFRRLADNAPDAIFRFDYLPERHFTYVSAAITAITGYRPEDYYSDPDLGWSRLHADDRVRFQQHLANPDRLRDPIEMRWIHRSGVILWVEQRNVPIFDAAGHVIAIEGIIRDITERKRVSEALHASEARLHMLLANTPAVIFTALAEPDYRTTFISDTIQAVLGYEPAQYLENPTFWMSRIHPEDRVNLISYRSTLLECGSLQIVYRCRHADDSYRWIENGLRLLPVTSDRPQEIIGYMIDITARKQAEEILRQANRDMAHAARMKDEFLANMSHELRSPLNAILGYCESLQDGIYDPITARQRNALRHIETSGRHLLDLITDILDLAKVEAGQLPLEIDNVIIAEVCQASLLFVKELAARKGLRLDVQLSGDMPNIEADPRRLKQMLINLLSNAVKFTPGGGQICLKVMVDATAGVIHFAVQDTGIGIAPEDLGRLFLPFSQIDATLSRQYEGTGLGLALVRRLAELHGGSVAVESSPGVGSCFTITLPLVQAVSNTGSMAEALALARRGVSEIERFDVPLPGSAARAELRVLLTDDNPETLLVISEYLRAKSYAVTTTQSGQDALDVVDRVKPAVILMDIQMPNLDGLEVIRRLRANPSTAITPIIALTALAMPGDKERCLAAGATAYLTKPVRLRLLAETIQELLERGV